MGFTLQNTAFSVNMKERLDFSCAIFNPTGQLIANAPHMPVSGPSAPSLSQPNHSQAWTVSRTST
jgi:N-methylhydantoinase B/oxoprolinase/acetone carboxylase alpha subunit